MQNMQKFLRTRTSKELAGLVALLLVAVFAAALIEYGPKNSHLAPATAHANGNALTGYAWSDTVGWLSFSGTAANGSPYGVSVDAGGVLSGYAWSDTIGWVTFGANSCGAQATMTAGALSGFAQAIGADAKGWDGCISLSGASPAYGPTLSGTTFTGYAWGSDVVGWLSFSGTAADGSLYSVVYGGTGAPTCTLSVAPNPAANSSSITLNYTTTNSPTTGIIKDASGTTVYSGSVNASGGIGATAPSSAGTYTYNMTVSSLSGTGSCSATLTTGTDICNDIPGLQTTLPSGCTGPTPSPIGSCIPAGYMWNGTSSCIPQPLSINVFSGPTRVRSGSTATLTYNITSPSSCSITGTNGYNSGPITTPSGTVTTSAITANTQFTLACTGDSKSITIGITPVYQEL